MPLRSFASFKLIMSGHRKELRGALGHGLCANPSLVTGLESIKNWFQLIHLILSWLWYCIRLPCVYDFEISYVSGS